MKKATLTPTPSQIGETFKELRHKLFILKARNAPYEELTKQAKAIQLCWEYYQKAKFGKVKTKLTVSGILRDSHL